MTVSCPIHKENCHGGRTYAGKVLRVGPTNVACGKAARLARWPTTDWAFDRVEGDLVRVGDGLSLERCAQGDGLLWRNGAHPAASLGACGHLDPTAPTVADHVATRKRTAFGDGDHRLDAGARVWWR